MDRLNQNSYVTRNLRRFLYKMHHPSPVMKSKVKSVFKKKRHNYAPLYNSIRWTTMRANQLLDKPLCEKCGAIAEVADHIQPHNGYEGLFFDVSNLQSLCRECNKAKTRKGM